MTCKRAVVLMSGGIDSATCLGIACNHYDEIIPVHFQYGQQTADIEMEMAINQRALFISEYPDTKISEMEIIDYHHVFRHFAQGVAEDGKDFGHMNENDGRSSGYVPVRNLHLIATGAAIADVNDATAVYHGAQMGDEADYPDCRPAFMDKAAAAIVLSVPEGQQLDLRVPLLSLTKPEVIGRAEEVGVPFELTYSCYEEVEDAHSPTPCGDCPACIERAEAFREAGVIDPYGTEAQV